MDIIFLDVDGVLNNQHTMLNTGEMLDEKCILRLKTIIDNTNTKIVLSSSWRLRSDSHIKLLLDSFSKCGINPNIMIDKTTSFKNKGIHQNRTNEILHWVNSHNVNKWVAIDDFPLKFNSDHFVQTDFIHGLTDKNVEQAIKIFNNNYVSKKQELLEKMNDNIIFLDVDGVLNYDINIQKFEKTEIDSYGNNNKISNDNFMFHKLHEGEGLLNINCIKRFGKIIENIDNVKIVISSYWRLSDWKLNSLLYYLHKYGNINAALIIGKTNRLKNRTDEILQWVKTNNNNINKWVAIDDRNLKLKPHNFFQTDDRFGLKDHDIEKIINLFK